MIFVLLREIFNALLFAAYILLLDAREPARETHVLTFTNLTEHRTYRVIVIRGFEDHSEKTSCDEISPGLGNASSNVHDSRVVDCRYWTRREYYAGRINLAASENRERCDARVLRVAAAPRKFFARFLSVRPGK